MPTPAQITSRTRHLLMQAQLSGCMNLDGHTPTPEEQAISARCREISATIARLLPDCPEHRLAELLDSYDMAYRVGYNHMPDPILLNRHRRRILTSWRLGNDRIPESTIFGIAAPIARHTDRRDPKNRADSDFLEAYLTLRDRWLCHLMRHDTFTDIPLRETYSRLALMMREPLATPAEESALKHRWYDRNRIDDLTSIDSPILQSYRRFTASLFPVVLDYAHRRRLDTRILQELCRRPDLPAPDRATYRLALTQSRP